MNDILKKPNESEEIEVDYHVDRYVNEINPMIDSDSDESCI